MAKRDEKKDRDRVWEWQRHWNGTEGWQHCWCSKCLFVTRSLTRNRRRRRVAKTRPKPDQNPTNHIGKRKLNLLPLVNEVDTTKHSLRGKQLDMSSPPTRRVKFWGLPRGMLGLEITTKTSAQSSLGKRGRVAKPNITPGRRTLLSRQDI